MKRILLVLAVLLTACGKESSVKPATPPTFLHYFNGGNNDVAQAVIETSDKGLLILATTEYTQPGYLETRYKIKLIKTDAYGNQLWQEFYPAFGGSKSLNYKAGGIALLNDGSDGIAIAGTSINGHGISSMMLLVVDKNGQNADTVTTWRANAEYNGIAVTQNASGEFILLGSALS